MHVFAKCADFDAADELRRRGLYPYFQRIEETHDTHVVIGGKRKLMVGSNNYMGLTHDPRIVRAAREAFERFGSGNTGSRFLNGNLELHDRLETELAAFVGKEAALVFSTGYQTNLGTIAALVGRGDSVVLDKFDHACIQDGARLSFGETLRFRHNDLEHLDQLLERAGDRGKLIVVDGVYSMEGDIAQLPEITRIARRHDAAVMVDDAHSLGVLGPNGAGTAEHFGITDQVDLITGTFSKSLASIGGFVAGDAKVIDYIRNHSRALIFSASIPPASAATVLRALEIIKEEPWRRERLWANTRKMRDGLRAAGFNIGDTETPIIPLIIGPRETTFGMWRALLDAGVFTNPVISPAVPENACRLRTSYMATHTDEQLDFVLDQIIRVGREFKVMNEVGAA
ncbi:MAG: aminotransferase class I/II-fold pyridoxal phosphate-dependent enzyme [Planctomycetota bacterium]